MKTLVLTGGSSGIGKATVELFASKGWRVFELSRHGESHNEITHFTCDVVDEQSAKAAIDKVMELVDHIDVLISNAGFGISGPIEFTNTEDAKHQFDVNFFGALNITKAVLPIMRKQGYGKILYTSSVAAVMPIPFQSFYSASKAAIDSFAMALANEVKPFGIQVACLLPGDVSTHFTDARQKNEVGRNVYKNIHSAVAAMEKDERNGMKPEQMARQYFKIAHKHKLYPRYIGGTSYAVLCFLERLLSKRCVNWIIGKLYS